jgi:putative ABC transport system ATP-binding protein
VAIARALVTNPAVILADEPTGNLDSASSRDIFDLLERLHSEGLTLVTITHDPRIASRADRVLRVEDGLIVDSGHENELGDLAFAPPPGTRPSASPMSSSPTHVAPLVADADESVASDVITSGAADTDGPAPSSGLEEGA